MDTLKNNSIIIINILAALLISIVAFIFIAKSFTFYYFPIIFNNKILLALAYLVICSTYVFYIVCYLYNYKTLYRVFWLVLVLICFCSVMFYLFNYSGFAHKINSIETLRTYIQGAGKWAAFIFILLQFLQVIILPLPGSVTVASGVILFGPMLSFIYSFIGITVGSLVAFFVGKVFGLKVVKWLVGEESLDRWLEGFNSGHYFIITAMFILPLFPDDILCFIAGLSAMSNTYFLIMIIITRFVSIFATAFSVGFIPFNTWWGISIWLVIAVLALLSVFIIYNHIKNKKQVKKF